MVESLKIPDINEMKEYFQRYLSINMISSNNTGELSRHTIKCFTELGKNRGFYVRAGNNFQELTDDKNLYPNDGSLLDIDLVWITDNPYHILKNTDIYDYYNTTKAKSEIGLALEYEATTGIITQSDNLTHQCDELWRLAFIMAKVKVLIYPTFTELIDNHILIFREAISNFGIQQKNTEWRIFAIDNDTIIGKEIFPVEES